MSTQRNRLSFAIRGLRMRATLGVVLFAMATTSFSQGFAYVWVDAGKCKILVGNDVVNAGLHKTWSGPCLNGLAHGKGRVRTVVQTGSERRIQSVALEDRREGKIQQIVEAYYVGNIPGKEIVRMKGGKIEKDIPPSQVPDWAKEVVDGKERSSASLVAQATPKSSSKAAERTAQAKSDQVGGTATAQHSKSKSTPLPPKEARDDKVDQVVSARKSPYTLLLYVQKHPSGRNAWSWAGGETPEIAREHSRMAAGFGTWGDPIARNPPQIELECRGSNWFGEADDKITKYIQGRVPVRLFACGARTAREVLEKLSRECSREDSTLERCGMLRLYRFDARGEAFAAMRGLWFGTDMHVPGWRLKNIVSGTLCYIGATDVGGGGHERLSCDSVVDRLPPAY